MKKIALAVLACLAACSGGHALVKAQETADFPRTWDGEPAPPDAGAARPSDGGVAPSR